ncbi:RNA polymerase sigma factor RpoH [Thioalkalivibrio sp. HK1]|uniref:RNA polymerase sigma factor RpoH n=1 Tax=Thioalkalivibrio sp. HK1 TaxID=1469245 RepID=UPI00046ED06D|nr:RNA polymerase sigma factor RpoH [Thioalkalivibrio sp. HK1]
MTNTFVPRLPAPTADLQCYLKEIQSFPMLGVDEERELAMRVRSENDIEAAWRLVTSHLRYVAKIARGYGGYGLPQEDLIQEGNVGLMKAVGRFDPTVGVRLVSFAVHWIRAEIHEFVMRNYRIVKVATTRAQRKLFFNLRKLKDRTGTLSHREAERIAEELEVEPGEVLEMDRRLSTPDTAFDGIGEEDGAQPPAAYMMADDSYDPEISVEREQSRDFYRERLQNALSRLDRRAREIVRRRRLEEPPAKLRELADEYGLSAERVRQIEAQALRDMKDTLLQAA